MSNEEIIRLYGEPYWRDWAFGGWQWERDSVGGFFTDQAIWRKGDHHHGKSLKQLGAAKTEKHRHKLFMVMKMELHHYEVEHE